jgi:hypothetical protein
MLSKTGFVNQKIEIITAWVELALIRGEVDQLVERHSNRPDEPKSWKW